MCLILCSPALEEELPVVGLAKDMMSKFKQKEKEAKNISDYQPSGAGNRGSILHYILLYM